MRTILLISIGFLAAGGLRAQQDAMFTRYMFNTMYLFNNPAYSGSHGYWTANALYRTQWLRFDGAPKTIYLGAEGTFADERMGLGFSLFHDRVGLDRVTDFSANYAYHIPAGDQGFFSIGIKAGAFVYKSVLSQAVVWDTGDPVYGGDINGVVPRAGLGVYYHNQRFFAGVSAPTLAAIDKRTDFNINLDRSGILQRHYYLYTGYVFSLESGIDLKPSVLLKYQPKAPFQADLNLNIWFKDLFSCGFSYRTNDAVSVMVEVPIGKKLSIGYAFDNTISDLQQVSAGTHEIMLGYNFTDVVKYQQIKQF